MSGFFGRVYAGNAFSTGTNVAEESTGHKRPKLDRAAFFEGFRTITV